MKQIVVIGGTGVAGTAAIRASREFLAERARITAVWFGRKEESIAIEGADEVIFGDVTDPECRAKIRTACGNVVDILFFATARGEVGFPIELATPEQIAEACHVSFDPLPIFEREFHPARIVSYSTFYTLKVQQATYGSMGHAKARIEAWTTEAPHRACIRAGAFDSESSRAIGLMLRRLARDQGLAASSLLRDFFEGRSTQEGLDRLREAAQSEEREAYGDSGTGPEGLLDAHRRLLAAPDARFVNVCGRKIWLSDDPQLLPAL
ncbi:MAG: hypothetical protein ACKVU1_00770 [bacterium]